METQWKTILTVLAISIAVALLFTTILHLPKATFQSHWDWTFESGTTEGWIYVTGHTYPNAPPGILTIKSTPTTRGEYTLQLSTSDPPSPDTIWMYANALYAEIPYQPITRHRISGWFMLEDTSAVQALQLVGVQVFNHWRLADTGVQWVNDPGYGEPQWRIWETGFYGLDKPVGDWKPLNVPQPLSNMTWYYFALEATVNQTYSSFHIGTDPSHLLVSLDLSRWPVTVAPPYPEDQLRPPQIVLELSIVAKPYHTAVVYWDNIEFAFDVLS